jgi:transposase
VIETKNMPPMSPELELLQKEIEILRSSLLAERNKNTDLRFQLDQLRRNIFGHKSERFVPENPAQLSLDFCLGEEVPVVPQKEEIAYTRLKKEKKAATPNVRLAIPAHLPRVIEIIEPENLPEGSKKIGEEITEVMEITPARIYVRCIIRPKYALPQEKGIEIAYLPSLPLPKSNAGSSLIAHLIVNKYVNHLPFYRQVQMFKRDGVDLAESTINNWFAKTADLLEPLYDRIWKHIREGDHIFADESTIQVLNVDKPGGSVKGYFWLFKMLDPGMVLFYYNKGSRGYHILHEVLPGFQGAVQCDGYGAYNELDNIKGIVTIGCWAHARRKFEQALENDPVPARYAMLKIQELYAIERKATEGNFTYDQIKGLREKESYPILKEFETWLLDTAQTVLPKSPIGKAIFYTYGIYRKLIRYTMDGRYHIDNNQAENSVRDLALGRKNYLFCGNHQAAERTAIIYSLMASCKVNDVNPQEWLTDVLNRIQDYNFQKLDELLPHQWKLNRP